MKASKSAPGAKSQVVPLLHSGEDDGGREPRQTSTDKAYDTLRKKIIDSELSPGSNVLEQELAVMLGLSRTPIREALVRLQNEGLVEIVPRHGVRIVPMSISDMKEIYEVLISLEATAVELVAKQRLSEDAFEPLVAHCREMEASVDKNDIEAWALADEAYHLKIMELCGNRRLAEIVMNCWDQVHRARLFTLRLRRPSQPRQSIVEHYEIIEALRKGDAKLASKCVRSHRKRGLSVQIETLESVHIHQF